MTIGSPFRYRIRVEADPGTQVVPRLRTGQIGDFVITDYGHSGDASDSTGRTGEPEPNGGEGAAGGAVEVWYELLAYESGSQFIPAPVVGYRTAEGEAGEVEGPRALINVDSLLPPPGSEVELRSGAGVMIARPATAEIVYTPPATAATIRDLLANWEKFIHARDDLEPLVRMAVAHYQFEAIHPFPDGNGRTGRVLNSLLLVDRGLLRLPILYMSRFIIENKEEYYRLLLGVTREAAWEPWLLYMLRGVEQTAGWTLQKINAMRELMDMTSEFLRAKPHKIYTRELVETIFEQPYCRIPHLVSAGIAKRQAASRYLKSLADVGVLEERSHGREKIWIHTRLLELLTRTT